MKIFAPFIDQAGRRRTLYRYYRPLSLPRESLFGWACFWIAIGLLIGVGMVSR